MWSSINRSPTSCLPILRPTPNRSGLAYPSPSSSACWRHSFDCRQQADELGDGYARPDLFGVGRRIGKQLVGERLIEDHIGHLVRLECLACASCLDGKDY